MTRQFANVLTVTGRDIEMLKVVNNLRKEHPFLGFVPSSVGDVNQWMRMNFDLYEITDKKVIEDKTIRFKMRMRTMFQPPVNLSYWFASNYRQLNIKLQYYCLEEKIRGEIKCKQGRITRNKVWPLNRAAIEELKLEGVWDEGLSDQPV